jgi:hypothetical protein
MQNEWRALAADSPIDSWERTRASMSEEVAALQAAGRWRSGERSLLAALGLADDERKLCTALRWLLQPHGHHGLGYALLRLLWERLDVQPENEHPVTATREERRGGTIADLVVRAPGAVVLIEAKVHAGEQEEQCDRLGALWAHEAPTLVFLTRDGRAPDTADRTAGQWTPLTWSEVADLTEQAARHVARPAGGVLDFIDTLRRGN